MRGGHGSVPTVIAGLLLAIFAGLGLQQARINAAIFDEPVHLAGGLAAVRWGDFRINPEHPPLVKVAAALPLLWLDPWPGEQNPSDGVGRADGTAQSWKQLRASWKAALGDNNAQWLFAHTLLYGVNDRALVRLGASSAFEIDPTVPPERDDYLNDTSRLLFWARAMVLPFGVALGVLVFIWSRQLYGAWPALFPLVLFSFDPNFVAHASLLTTDVAASLFLTATMYFLWRWWGAPTARNAAGFCACMGLASVSKFSAVLIVPIVIVTLGVASWGMKGRTARVRRLVSATCLLAVAGVVAVAAIWSAYGFRHSATGASDPTLPFERVVRETAVTRYVVGRWPEVPSAQEIEAATANAEPSIGDRALLWIARSRLLPEAYVYGVAIARSKSLARYSFLNGEVSLLGFPDYFAWTFVLKTPLITLLAVLLATALAIARFRARPEFAFLIVPPLVYFSLVSLGNLNIGHRHLLPIYPFLFVSCASLFDGGPLRRFGRSGVAVAAGLAALSASFVFAPPWRPTRVQPDPLAFFNELAGGPAAGARRLVDSNLDWGQDLGKLARWLREREIHDPIGLCYFGSADPRYHGIAHVKLPGGYEYEPPFRKLPRFRVPKGGWVAISATHLAGVYFTPELRAAWLRFLQGAELVDVVGHSIFVYQMPERRR